MSSTLPPLCECCSIIPLAQVESIERNSWNLGSWGRIKHSDCPFCKLIVRAKQSFYQTHSTTWSRLNIPTSENIELSWFSRSGPEGRAGFTFDQNTLQIFICASSRPNASPNHPSSAYVRPTVEAEFDVDRLSRWISTCTQTHHDTCTVNVASFEQAFRGLDSLRFIDTEKESIVSIRRIPRYVALSYVWGQAATVTLTTNNMDVLQRSGGLREAWHQIPLTIRDAIDLNDASDVSKGVQVMDAVYERSWLTIVAASGHDANAGLPGIQDRSRFAMSPIRITDELYMDIFIPLDRLLKRSVYSSRAWTFQEQLLARRAVFFVENQIFFRCREGIYSEHVFDQPSQGVDDLFSWASILQSTAALSEPLIDFQSMLLYYTTRALTDQNDVLRALTGMIRRVSESARCQFLQGIPTAAFDTFLTFRARWGRTKRRKGFPSYSWAGWNGGIYINDGPNTTQDLSKWLEEETWIVWYKRSSPGVVSLVWDPATSNSFPPDDQNYAGYRQRRCFRPPQTSTDPLIASTRTYPTETLRFELSPTPYHLLQFWSLSIYFKLYPENVFEGSAFIVDRFGVRTGTITLDGIDEGTFFNWGNIYELVLLSGVDPEGKIDENDTIARYWVMLLEWKEHVAERRGMGQIRRDVIYNGWAPGPTWKEIILG